MPGYYPLLRINKHRRTPTPQSVDSVLCGLVGNIAVVNSIGPPTPVGLGQELLT